MDADKEKAGLGIAAVFAVHLSHGTVLASDLPAAAAGNLGW